MEVLGEFAKYAFCVLKRKRRDFERSVLKYVSIKNQVLTQSGPKSRVCVNQPDRLLPLFRVGIHFVLGAYSAGENRARVKFLQSRLNAGKCRIFCPSGTKFTVWRSFGRLRGVRTWNDRRMFL